jgi:hypothetical protein
MNFKTVEEDIEPILKYSDAAKCDDMTLYATYVYNKLQSKKYTSPNWLEKVFSDRRFRVIHGIAPYETVSRVRRRLQAKNILLRPTKEYKEERKKLEKEYKRYAREGAKSCKE